MNQPELTLVLIGFGNVARRFVKLLGETADRLDFSWKIVGIATRHHGSVVDPAGVDTRRAITTVEGRQSLDRLDPSPRERSGIDVSPAPVPRIEGEPPERSSILTQLLHEYTGLLYYRLRGWL